MQVACLHAGNRPVLNRPLARVLQKFQRVIAVNLFQDFLRLRSGVHGPVILAEIQRVKMLIRSFSRRKVTRYISASGFISVP